LTPLPTTPPSRPALAAAVGNHTNSRN
jgi:hypothetical protein